MGVSVDMLAQNINRGNERSSNSSPKGHTFRRRKRCEKREKALKLECFSFTVGCLNIARFIQIKAEFLSSFVVHIDVDSQAVAFAVIPFREIGRLRGIEFD